MSQWKLIPDFPNYVINRKGEVRDLDTGRILQTSHNNKGVHVHMSDKYGRVVAKKPAVLKVLAFPKDYE